LRKTAMKVDVYLLSAFPKDKNGGNPAGVVLHAGHLNEVQMQETARRVGYSETAFVSRSEKADYRLRFFTPCGEVDMCGHATIAAFYLLWRQGILGAGTVHQETKAGVLEVRVGEEGRVSMSQTLPVFYDTVSAAVLKGVLKTPEHWIGAHGAAPLPAQIVSTGLRDLLVPIDTREHLAAISPDLCAMRDFSREKALIGFHLFSLDTLSPSAAAHCRNFAPLCGIDEEAATGSASGALACYLLVHGALDEHRAKALVFEQGYSMGRPSEIMAELAVKDEAVVEVVVKGRAFLFGETEVEL
jgi:PhzF family phenazine biosynthesis protein